MRTVSRLLGMALCCTLTWSAVPGACAESETSPESGQTTGTAGTIDGEPILAGAELDNFLLPVDRPDNLAHVVSLVFNGYRRGKIEPCGCISHKLGGIDKEARLAARLEEMHIPRVQVDAGGFAENVAHPGAMLHTCFQLEALHALKTEAVNVGYHDLAFGLPFLRDAQTSYSIPFISCNVTDGTSTPLFAPYKKVTVTLQGGEKVRLGVIGATRPRTISGHDGEENNRPDGTDWHIQNAAECIRKYLPELRRESDAVVLLMYGSQEQTREVLEELGNECGIKVAVAGETPGQIATPEDLNGTWFVSGGYEGRQVGHLMLPFADGKLTATPTRMINVVQTIPPVPEFTKIIERLRKEDPNRE